jgi:hypothetical protein
MGVILWSEEEQRLWLRLRQQDERLPAPSDCDEMPAAQARAYLGIARQADGRHAPYLRTKVRQAHGSPI